MSGEQINKIVASLQDKWGIAFGKRDWAALVQLYDKNALFFGSAPELCATRGAIRAYFEDLPQGIALADFAPLSVVEINPNLAIASGFWTFRLNGESLAFRLSWTLLNRDGQWLIAQHHAGLKPGAKL